MNTRTSLFLILAAFTLTAAQARADSLVEGSIEAGKAKAITCTACHGAEGNSANPLWPNIAGQHAAYIEAQLHAFKSGKRKDPLMAAQAMMLSDEDIKNIAVYFESLPAAAQPVADTATIKKGEAIYRGGNAETGVAACHACHGPTGRGNPAARYPAIQGQHATYAAKTLRDYASGARVSADKTQMMRDIASRLSEEEIVALASYIQGLRP